MADSRERGGASPHAKYRSILIFGPPGSGKGTVGTSLCSAGGLCHLSSGHIFRGLSADSPSGKLYHQYADEGNLVPDEVTIEVWKNYVSGMVATNRYFPERQVLLLDGIPRTLQQAEILDEYIDVRHIIVLTVQDEEELIVRLQRRAKIEGRIDDSRLDILQTRFEVYHNETAEVLQHYPDHLLSTYNAQQKPLEVLRDVLIGVAPLLSAMTQPVGKAQS